MKLQGLEMEQRKFFFYVDSSFMGLLWISSEKDGQRIILGGGLNFPIREFLGRKIWQGIGIFNR